MISECGSHKDAHLRTLTAVTKGSSWCSLKSVASFSPRAHFPRAVPANDGLVARMTRKCIPEICGTPLMRVLA